MLTAAATRLALPAGLRGDPEVWVVDARKLGPEALRPDGFDRGGLDEDERARAARLQLPDDRDGYVAAHVLLRSLLAGRLGMATSEIGYVRAPCPRCCGPHGRPELRWWPVSPTLRFSLSRRGTLALVALADVAVGVDIEALADRDTVASVGAALHPAERAELDGAPVQARAAVFTRLWARKEAYLKGVGVGIAVELAAEDPAGDPDWELLDLPVAEGYAGALALHAGPLALHAGALGRDAGPGHR